MFTWGLQTLLLQDLFLSADSFPFKSRIASFHSKLLCGMWFAEGKGVILCLAEARAVPALWCPCNSRGSCAGPALRPQLWAPSASEGCPRVLLLSLLPSPPSPRLSLVCDQINQQQQPQQRRAALFEAVPPECAHRFHRSHLPCLAAAVTSCASSLC